jgi:hypothetical protein
MELSSGFDATKDKIASGIKEGQVERYCVYAERFGRPKREDEFCVRIDCKNLL